MTPTCRKVNCSNSTSPPSKSYINHHEQRNGKVIIMKPLPHLNDFLNTPDFWMLLLCNEIMGEDRFREFLKSMKNKETSDMLEKGKAGNGKLW